MQPLAERLHGLARELESYAMRSEVVKNLPPPLERVPGKVRLLIEGTAGAGTSLGGTFEELAAMRALIPQRLRKHGDQWNEQKQ